MNCFQEINLIQTEIEHTLNKCTYCGRCVARCDILGFLDLKEKKASKIVEKKHHFLQTGIPDEDIKKIIFSCSMCGKCNSVCPEGLSPYLVMLGLRIKWRECTEGFPSVMNKVLPQNKYSYYKLVETLTLKKSYLTDVDFMRAVPLTPSTSKQILYLGCQLMPRSDILLTLFDVMKLIGYEDKILSGPDLCCGYLNMMAGDLKTANKMVKDLINAFQRTGADEIIFWCSDCYRRAREYLEITNSEEDFKLTTLVEYLAENVDKWKFKNPIRDIVTYHDSCPLCFYQIYDAPRKIIESIPGLEFREMKHNRERAKCCSGNASRLIPQVAEKLCEQRVVEALKTGAKKLITSCYGCERRFDSFIGQKYGITYPHLIMLIAQGNDIYHDNTWAKLTRTRNVEYIIEACAEEIDQSPFDEEDIRRELPQYL